MIRLQKTHCYFIYLNLITIFVTNKIKRRNEGRDKKNKIY